MSPDTTPPPVSEDREITIPSGQGSTLGALVNGPGDYRLTLTWEGTERPYILHVPPAYDGTKVLPLVYILHGFDGSAAGMVKVTGMNAKADQDGFLVAYLNGTGERPEWNVSDVSLSPDHVPADDVGYIRALSEQLKAELKVDGKRIYAAGLSNGGAMSHRLAASLPDVLAGVAVVEGAIGYTDAEGKDVGIPTPAGRIPVLIIHGLQDPNVLYYGGMGYGGASAEFGFNARSVADAVALWTATDLCTGSPMHHVSPNGNIIVDDYTNCANSSEVKLVTIVNGGHQWPTLESQTKFSATDAIWKFFSLHSKND